MLLDASARPIMRHSASVSRCIISTAAARRPRSAIQIANWSIIALTPGAKSALHIIRPLRRLLVATKSRNELGQLHEIGGTKVGSPLGLRHERFRHRQVGPRTRNRGYRAIGAFVPDPITVPARPVGDARELLAQQRMKRMDDANSLHLIRQRR